MISLLEEFGFTQYGTKGLDGELVYVRDFKPRFFSQNPKISFPYIGTEQNIFLIPIYPGYHTDLLPDSFLKTESPKDFVEHEPHRNAISKVYI